ncbi:PucR family transcriptional regulator [Streptomyces sp. Inha503]|uniref:PucR family transcriptional regulator n=1 Tax=Streptomyces sp. Inha503 TaxID=3383314 RepID=UPI00399FCC0E
MSLTIQSLVEDPMLRTRIIAGHAGAERLVTWAHTCELGDPWNWLGSGDLLMTAGYGLPPGADAQAELIRNLARADIAGLAVAEGLVAPEVTAEAMAVADELAFPVLTTARNVPFVSVARFVADSNNSRSSMRLTQVLRLYDVLRRANLRRTASSTLLDELAGAIRGELHVIDTVRGRELLPTRHRLRDELRSEALARIDEHKGQLPAFSRVGSGQVPALVLPVGRDVAAALVVCARGADEQPDPVLAQHAAMIVEMEVERCEAQASREREQRATLARRLLEGSLAPEAASAQLSSLGLGGGPWRISAWECADAANGEDLARALAVLDMRSAYAAAEETHMVLLREQEFAEPLQDVIPAPPAVVGVSRPVSSPSRFPDAFREARWALEGARETQNRFAVYGAHGSSFMPRTVAEGEAVVARLLGPLLEYDDRNDTDLLHSLSVFFEANRSWQEGAKRLGVHKQTLAYRMKKIEALTSMDLHDFASQAELFYALRTWKLLQTS